MFRTGRLSSNTQIVRGVVDRVSAAARVVGGGGRRLSSDHARGCCAVQCARNLRSTPKQEERHVRISHEWWAAGWYVGAGAASVRNGIRSARVPGARRRSERGNRLLAAE